MRVCVCVCEWSEFPDSSCFYMYMFMYQDCLFQIYLYNLNYPPNSIHSVVTLLIYSFMF